MPLSGHCRKSGSTPASFELQLGVTAPRLTRPGSSSMGYGTTSYLFNTLHSGRIRFIVVAQRRHSSMPLSNRSRDPFHMPSDVVAHGIEGRRPPSLPAEPFKMYSRIYYVVVQGYRRKKKKAEVHLAWSEGLSTVLWWTPSRCLSSATTTFSILCPLYIPIRQSARHHLNTQPHVPIRNETNKILHK